MENAATKERREAQKRPHLAPSDVRPPSPPSPARVLIFTGRLSRENLAEGFESPPTGHWAGRKAESTVPAARPHPIQTASSPQQQRGSPRPSQSTAGLSEPRLRHREAGGTQRGSRQGPRRSQAPLHTMMITLYSWRHPPQQGRLCDSLQQAEKPSNSAGATRPPPKAPAPSQVPSGHGLWTADSSSLSPQPHI